MPNLCHKSARFKVKSADEINSGEGIIEGYASVFNNQDSYGDVVLPGAFTESLKALADTGRVLPLLYNHDANNIVGEVQHAAEDEHGLFVRCRFDMDDASAAKIFRSVKARRLDGLSFAFRVLDGELGKVLDDDVFFIRAAEIFEVSVVLVGANNEARIDSVKSAEPREKSDAAADSRAELLSSLTDKGAEYLRVLDGLPRNLAKFSPELRSAQNDTVLAARSIPDEATFIERTFANELKAKAEQRGDGLRPHEAEKYEFVKGLEAYREDRRQRAETLQKLKDFGLHADDNYHLDSVGNPVSQKGNPSMSNNLRLPSTHESRSGIAYHAVKELQTKSAGSPATSGSLVVPVAVDPEVVPLPKRPTSLFDLVPTTLQTSPVFQFNMQTVRNNRAAVVEPGAVKPKSDYGFKAYEGVLRPVAHLVPHINEYMLEDTADLTQFINTEMIHGVIEAVEGWLYNVMLGTEGAQLVPFKEDAFTTTRLAKAALNNLGLMPGAFALNPNDWALMETAKASGSGTFLFHAAPVDQTNGTLWGVPVVTSHHIPEGHGFAIDTTALAVRTDNRLKLEWNRSEADFERNEVTFRAEGRFAPVVYNGPGVVQMLLNEEAAQLKADPAVPGPVAMPRTDAS